MAGLAVTLAACGGQAAHDTLAHGDAGVAIDSSLLDADSGTVVSGYDGESAADVTSSSDAQSLSDGGSEAQSGFHCVAVTPQASDYDQTCNVDQDCAPVPTGDFCHQCVFAAINVTQEGAYSQALASLSGMLSCMNEGPTCCRSGHCTIGASVCNVPEGGPSDASPTPDDVDAGSGVCEVTIMAGADSQPCESAGGVCVANADCSGCNSVPRFFDNATGDTGCPREPWAVRCCTFAR